MPAVQYLIKEREYQPTRISVNTLKNLFLLAGICGLALNYFHNDRYRATDLLPVNIILKENPRLIGTGAGASRSYQLKSDNYRATFIICHGALSMIERNNATYNIFSSLHAGDTIQAQVQAQDESLINKPDKGIRVIGCEARGQRLFTPSQVEEKENNNWRLNIAIAIALLLIGLVMQAKQIIHWINSSNEAAVTVNPLPASLLNE
ncbi:hypothetical protein ACE38W_13385 [Chitinophaga sp. Hz27]|uniref:hypothetical protein n=1 Tax=Chitinophaga sp. Hz27 TaxID=3347169 RepID=UPI0035D76235